MSPNNLLHLNFWSRDFLLYTFHLKIFDITNRELEKCFPGAACLCNCWSKTATWKERWKIFSVYCSCWNNWAQVIGPPKTDPRGILQGHSTDFLHAVLVLGWKCLLHRFFVSPITADAEQLRTGLKSFFLHWMKNGDEPLSKQFQHDFLYVTQAKSAPMIFSSSGLL